VATVVFFADLYFVIRSLSDEEPGGGADGEKKKS